MVSRKSRVRASVFGHRKFIMELRSLSYVLLELLALASVARGLYFHIAETEQKCFIEEVPAETMIVGKYAERAPIVRQVPQSAILWMSWSFPN